MHVKLDLVYGTVNP